MNFVSFARSHLAGSKGWSPGSLHQRSALFKGAQDNLFAGLGQQHELTATSSCQFCPSVFRLAFRDRAETRRAFRITVYAANNQSW